VTQPGRAAALLAAVAASLGCSTGEGEGQVSSDRLFVEGCWNGSFSLDPTFFAAQPHFDEAVMIRVQRGDGIEEVSDGLLVTVTDVAGIRAGQLGVPLDVGMPVGVRPPGFPIKPNPNPPKVSLSLYLQESCHLQNATLYSIDGTITFHSLFSGDPNEGDAEDRLTHAEFSANFADPRKAIPSDSERLQFPPEVESQVSGFFRFYFQRGQPAQRFP
jgi:hypothetical protein